MAVAVRARVTPGQSRCTCRAAADRPPPRRSSPTASSTAAFARSTSSTRSRASAPSAWPPCATTCGCEHRHLRGDSVSHAARAAVRHPRHVLLGGLVVGLVCAGAGELGLAGVAVALALGLALGARGHPAAGLALAATATVFAGTVLGSARLAALDRTTLGPLLGHTVSIRATLLERPRAPHPRGGGAPGGGSGSAQPAGGAAGGAGSAPGAAGFGGSGMGAAALGA